jgi:hypothetical protein
MNVSESPDFDGVSFFSILWLATLRALLSPFFILFFFLHVGGRPPLVVVLAVVVVVVGWKSLIDD